MTSRKQPSLLAQTPETPRLRWEGVTCSPEPPFWNSLLVLSSATPALALFQVGRGREVLP